MVAGARSCSFMRIRPAPHRALVFFFALFAAQMAFPCDYLPPGQPLWIRLSAPVSTYTNKPGDPVHAILTQDLVCENEVLLPMGTTIDGIVRSKRKVGWGIRHETAALELEFHHATAPSGTGVSFTA